MGLKGYLRVIWVIDLLVKRFWKIVTVSNTLMYFHGTWIQWSLGKVTHVTSAEMGVKSHLRVTDFLGKFLKTVTVSTYFGVLPWEYCWIQWSLGRVTHTTSTYWKIVILMYFLGTWTWWFLSRLTHINSTGMCWNYSGIFYFCQYLHIGAGIISFGGDVFRL